MNKKVTILICIIAFLVVSCTYFFISHRNPGISPERYEEMMKLLQSIVIRNDSNNTVIAEFIKDGKNIREEYEPGRTINQTQGNVRIFVPAKKGWYTVEYPYPYQLTKPSFLSRLSKIFVDGHFVIVNLSALINSVTSGEVAISPDDSQGLPVTMVKNIKVTYKAEK